MLQLIIGATIFTFAYAVADNDDEVNEDVWNDCESHRSCWSAVEVKYHQDDIPICYGDGDCEPGFYCLNHMWEYNYQTESGRGCWRGNVCAGTGAYQMFIERKQQWFCSEE